MQKSQPTISRQKSLETIDQLVTLSEEREEDLLSQLDCSSRFSTAGLKELRQKIKDVMIPLLIKIFQLRQSKEEDLPTRLTNRKEKPEEEITQELHQLEEDVKQLQLWCSSCLSQIDKALHPGEQRERILHASKDKSSLSLTRSFTELASFKLNNGSAQKLYQKIQDSSDSKSSALQGTLQKTKTSLFGKLFSLFKSI